MSEEFLYTELFRRSSPTKHDKKEANDDVLNSLFAMEAPVKKKENESKKNNVEDEEMNYLNRVRATAGKTQNQVSIIAKKIKEERNLPSKSKSNVEIKVEKAMKAATKTENTISKPKLYMPNIVDPLGATKGKA